MFQRLEDVEKRYEELNGLIADPEVISNQNEWKKLMKEHSDIEDIVIKYREYKSVKQNMDEAKEMLGDPEMEELARAEYEESKEKLPKLEEELKILLIPKDPNDEKNYILGQIYKRKQVLVEKKLLYLQELCLECIQCMQKENILK